jgi:hypothetical protein
MNARDAATGALKAALHRVCDLVARYVDARHALARERARSALLEDALSRQIGLTGQLLRAGQQEVEK